MGLCIYHLYLNAGMKKIISLQTDTVQLANLVKSQRLRDSRDGGGGQSASLCGRTAVIMPVSSCHHFRR